MCSKLFLTTPSQLLEVDTTLLAIALPLVMLNRNTTLPFYSSVKPGTIITKLCLNTYKWLSVSGHASFFPFVILFSKLFDILDLIRNGP